MIDTVVKPSSFSSILQNNKEELAKIESYKNTPISVTPRNILFVILVFFCLVTLSVFAMSIITGTLALVVLVITALVVYWGFRFFRALDPLVKQKTKNMQLNMMVKEARKNAVAQLNNQVINNQERLEAARQARNSMGATVEKLKNQINPENKGKPIYEKKVELYNRVNAAYQQVLVKVDNAAKANKAFEEKVKEYKDMEEFASTASAAMSLFAQSGDLKLDETLSLEAFSQIETDFNESLISVENSARDMLADDNF